MNDAFKIQAFSQSISQSSTTKKAILGQLRIFPDGRKFRYGKAGGALVAGSACVGAVAVANHFGQVQTSGAANAVGATQVSVYVGATEVTANQYDDGFLQMYRGAAGTVGRQYKIASHTVSAAGGEIITVTLDEPLQVATLTTDYFSLIPNRYSSVTEVSAKATNFAGVAVCAVASGSYAWLQTGGPACCKTEGTAALGSKLGLSDTAKELELGNAYTDMTVAEVWAIANVAGYWSPVWLKFD